MKISERAVLASLHVGSWSGKAYDSAVSEEVSEQKDASKSAGRYQKQLADAGLLRGVGGAISLARKTHERFTLPWSKDARILSTQTYQDYVKRMHQARLDVEAEADKATQLYPAYINSAENKKRLGKMFNPDDYPTPEEFRAKFHLDVEINKVPEAGDFRAELSEATVGAVVKDIERRSKARVDQALNNVFERVAEVTEKMVERLRAFDNANGKVANGFRDSLVLNIKDVADMLPSLNITGDQRIEKLRDQLLDQLVQSPDALKANEALRKATASKAEAILNRVRGYMV